MTINTNVLFSPGPRHANIYTLYFLLKLTMKHILYWDSMYDNYVYIPENTPVFGWLKRVMKGSKEQCAMRAVSLVLVDRGCNPEDPLYRGCN